MPSDPTVPTACSRDTHPRAEGGPWGLAEKHRLAESGPPQGPRPEDGEAVGSSRWKHLNAA